MSYSPIPERPLLVFPSLVATIGLEEATMVSVLDEMVKPLLPQPYQGLDWYHLTGPQLREAMPFWSDHDLQRISQSLRAKGALTLQSEPFLQSHKLIFAFNPASSQQSAAVTVSQTAPLTPVGAGPISPNWQPSEEVIARIAQQGIDRGFICAQIDEFVTYWRESGEHQRSWGSKFHQHVIHQWRQRETFTVQQERNLPIDRHWRPNMDAMEILVKNAGINQEFVEDAIPEFILYCAERGDRSSTWNKKFVDHVRRQWARYNSVLENNSEPKPIPPHWQPGPDVYDVLKLANIDIKFAQSLVPEFVLYWRDSRQAQTSWNTKFLQHIKYHWAKRHALTTAQGNGHAANTTTRRTRDRSLVDDLNDRSWAS